MLNTSNIYFFNYLKIVCISVAYAFGIENFTGIGLSWSRNERLYKLKYRMHNAYVLQTVPKDSMLIHQSADGWLPLCKYLDEDVPVVPYPHQNKNASLFHEDLNKSFLLKHIINEMKISLSCLICITGVCSWYYYYNFV